MDRATRAFCSTRRIVVFSFSLISLMISKISLTSSGESPSDGSSSSISLGRAMRGLPSARIWCFPPAGDLLRVPSIDLLPFEKDLPVSDFPLLRFEETGDRFQRRALPRTVASQQGHNLSLGHNQGESLENKDHVRVDHLDVVHLEHTVR